jgi:competence protein ComEC
MLLHDARIHFGRHLKKRRLIGDTREFASDPLHRCGARIEPPQRASQSIARVVLVRKSGTHYPTPFVLVAGITIPYIQNARKDFAHPLYTALMLARKRLYAAFLLLLLAALNVWVARTLWQEERPTLRVSVLDIGQGDSILVQSPTGATMLIDGGPDDTVLRRLAEELGPLDRSLSMVVETHPDKDHIFGLADVFKQYAVQAFMEPGIPDDTQAASALARAWQAEPGVQHVIARRGMRIDLGGGAYADVLWPDRDPSKFETNDGSIVMHLVYGTTSFMLTGDAPSPIEDWLQVLDKDDGELPTDVLKAGHHGSKYSTDDAWLTALHPSTVAISAGKGNPYGHPNQETLDRIRAEGATIYSTIDSGTLHFISDGTTIAER